MSRKQLEEPEVERKILEILEWRRSALSIKQITEKLEEDYGIKRSPQVIYRYLKNLKRKKKIVDD